MFASLAPRLRAMGWLATIPLMPPGRDRDGNPVNTKRPAITGWETFNSRAPTDPEISAWARFYPAGGIGLAYGPDRVVGIDLDWQDRETAAATWDIAQRILGPTPLIRIGAPPKRLALYRAADGLRVEGKAFGGFEVFTRSGQTVLYGLHPGTGRAYAWPEESPLTVGPDKLPVVTSEHITALIQGLAPYRPARALPPRSPSPRPSGAACRAPSMAASDRTTGMAAELMPALREAPDPIAEAAAILAATPHGQRHYTMVGAVVALMHLGHSDTDIRVALEPVYIDLTAETDRPQARRVFGNAIAWARDRIGPDDATAMATVPMEAIASAWAARWGRG